MTTIFLMTFFYIRVQKRLIVNLRISAEIGGAKI